MLKDFNPHIMLQEEKLKQERLKKIIDEEKNRNELLKKLYLIIRDQKSEVNELDKQIENLEVKNQNVGVISKFLKSFKLGKGYKTDLEIQKLIREKQKLEKELENNQNQVKTIQNQVKAIQNQKEVASEKVNKCVKEEDERLVITDEDYVEKFTEKSYEDIDIDKKVLVHCTNLFPKNHMLLTNYDGDKIQEEDYKYRDVNKKVNIISHRHTLHFTINNRVQNTSKGEGTWDDRIYMIVDQLKPIKNKIEHESPSDSWTGESIKLSNEAVILVKLQEKDRLKKENLNGYKVCYYDGDPIKCLRNFLKINGYETIETYANYSAHSESARSLQEKTLNERDFIINYMKDNKYLKKDIPMFSAKEMAVIIDILPGFSDPSCRLEGLIISEIEKDSNFEFQKPDLLRIADFMIRTGVKKTEDGKYKFASDEDVYKIAKAYTNTNDAQLITIDDGQLNLIKEMYNLREELHKEYEARKHPSFEEIASMKVKDLYKFENQLALETLQKNIKIYKHTWLRLIAEGYLILGIKFRITLEENEERNINIAQINNEKGINFAKKAAEILADEIDGELFENFVFICFDKETTAQEIVDKAKMLSMRRDEIVDELKEEIEKGNRVTKK